MAEPAGAVDRLSAPRVEPDLKPVGFRGNLRITRERHFLAGDLHRDAEAVGVPGGARLAERFQSVEFAEVGKGGIDREREETGSLAWNSLQSAHRNQVPE